VRRSDRFEQVRREIVNLRYFYLREEFTEPTRNGAKRKCGLCQQWVNDNHRSFARHFAREHPHAWRLATMYVLAALMKKYGYLPREAVKRAMTWGEEPPFEPVTGGRRGYYVRSAPL